ncbi:hypothetical protein [Amphiplicatus metriothermophilus]|uniref:Uncharacterized protein n=1 Tax=Amphiplicatus metriothermophilus TaxID=1519374 RepID=A0A239PX05_9PROT|nr:hypothetical protein [Amphiplicatus metriothermophilus]MBB5519882.1 hypothetical protein [Amphiplicatus metriothermophilus]SNT74785.1 hypothetical protein SAMN06297382_2369 [Amphiplicatus metriothermophilus]
MTFIEKFRASRLREAGADARCGGGAWPQLAHAAIRCRVRVVERRGLARKS